MGTTKQITDRCAEKIMEIVSEAPMYYDLCATTVGYKPTASTFRDAVRMLVADDKLVWEDGTLYAAAEKEQDMTATVETQDETTDETVPQVDAVVEALVTGGAMPELTAAEKYSDMSKAQLLTVACDNGFALPTSWTQAKMAEKVTAEMEKRAGTPDTDEQDSAEGTEEVAAMIDAVQTAKPARKPRAKKEAPAPEVPAAPAAKPPMGAGELNDKAAHVIKLFVKENELSQADADAFEVALMAAHPSIKIGAPEAIVYLKSVQAERKLAHAPHGARVAGGFVKTVYDVLNSINAEVPLIAKRAKCSDEKRVQNALRVLASWGNAIEENGTWRIGE